MLNAITIIFSDVIRFLFLTWWFWIFFLLWAVFKSLLLHWRQEVFKSSINWVLLELRIPREVKKSAKAMEQVFAYIHSLKNSPGSTLGKYWQGEICRWFSFEIVSFGGETHFFIRTYEKYRPLIEAAFFSMYPDIEITEVGDYTDQFPQNLRDLCEIDFGLWGTEIALSREEAYPIRTYPSFENFSEDEKAFDSMSGFLEFMGKFRKGEIFGIQILVYPADSNWKDKWSNLLKQLKENRESEGGAKAKYSTVVDFPGGGPLPAFSVAKSGGEEKSPGGTRTPYEIDTLKAVENNLSKPAFHTLIRCIYISPKSIFNDTLAKKGISGVLNQYAELNSFTQNGDVSATTANWQWNKPFASLSSEYKVQRLLYNYKKREIPPQTWMGKLITSYFFNSNFKSKLFILTTEELATIFHPPTSVVLTAPHIRRIESRKTGPPAGLAIYGEEKEIEKYQKSNE